MNENLKVSTITVTRNRVKFLMKSIRYFIEQTHSNKEMLILYYSDDESTSEYLGALTTEYKTKHSIRVFKHIPMEGMYLGALRNYIISKAIGDYICIWDDDDYYDPSRIDTQLSAIVENDLVACTLRSLLLFSEHRQEVKLSHERPEGWEGSLMCRRDKMALYSNLPRYEDTPVLEKLFIAYKALSIHAPEMYVYHLHDTNISLSLHKEELFNNAMPLNGAKNYEIKRKIGYLL